MRAAIIWGLIQGLSEFLPISSSGHLVLVPAFLSQFGLETPEPSLGVSAVLHLGTLVAVLIYFRTDLLKILRFRHDQEARHLLLLLVVGTIPAGIGFFVRDVVADLQESVTAVSIALLGTTVILLLGQRFATRARQLEDGTLTDAFIVGLAQAFALIPGISRSGTTIAAGNGRGFEPAQAARYSFLLGIPAIAAAGLLEGMELLDSGGLGIELLVGAVVAGVSGYAAISFLLAVIRRTGLVPFAVYTAIVGLAGLILL
ncbi:MAG: undecaprenyl-diphosphatase [Acidimicrobiia bacterium]|nr:undecaprenyl-diphosphatase [Acidimicrobiia bacterium]